MFDIKRITLLVLSFVLALGSPQSLANESALDVSFVNTTLVDDWGLSAHYRQVGSNGFGFDLGYQYLNNLTYDAFGASNTHDFDQFEAGLVWQSFGAGLRLHTKAGGLLSNDDVSVSGNNIISRFEAGYQLGAGLSMPISDNFRVFTELGYEGWLDSEIPSHLRFKYGLSLSFYDDTVNKIRLMDNSKARSNADRRQQLLENPPVTINTDVPEYLPGHLSASLPPIITLTELCKCLPAGPYTLELGKFTNIQQATRGLEYRGLRQFFNSRSYQLAPQAVFLSQMEDGNVIRVYLGELNSLASVKYWHHELRKNGLNARPRKVINSEGGRISNSMVDLDNSLTREDTIAYSAADIKRMNSITEEIDLANDESMMSEDQRALNDKAEFDLELEAQRTAQNASATSVEPRMTSVLQVGPMALDDLDRLLSMPAMQKLLSRSTTVWRPTNSELIWDEEKQQAWLSFKPFNNAQQIDEWVAWLNTENVEVLEVEQTHKPLGDVYHVALGHEVNALSVEMDRDDSMSAMMQRIRSPEVLWFQAYERIRDHVVKTSLNWSVIDKRYHLNAVNIRTSQEQQKIWENLSAVGLLPSLPEPN